MQETRKVLVTLTFPPEIIPGFGGYVEKLERHGFQVHIDPTYTRVPEQTLIKALEGVYALVSGSELLTETVFANAPSLKIVSRMGAGWDEMDIPAATRHGVAVSTSPGANAEAVAEHALALLLALNRRVIACDRNTRSGNWDKVFGETLYRQTMGIVGMGAIGRILARLVAGFDMRVLAYDPLPDLAWARQSGVEFVPLETLLRESDVVSVNCPLLEETRGLIGKDEFALMKPGARLVNCARGYIVDEAAMIQALRSGKLAGAALDAYDLEPVNRDNPLLTMDNVVLSPHTAGMTYGGRGKVIEMAFQNVIDLSQGGSTKGLLNPEVLKSL